MPYFSPDDINFEHPMGNIAVSVYLTRMTTANQKVKQHYQKFAEYRNTHIEEIAAKAAKVVPAKIHQPLEDILQRKGIEVNLAVDFVGGTGKHAKWLFDQHQSNIIYSDVKNLTQNLPKTFADLEAKDLGFSTTLLIEKENPAHWVYGVTALPNEVNVVKCSLNGLYRQGLSKKKGADLFMGNDMMFAVHEADDKRFGREVDSVLEPGGIADVSGRNMIKYGRPITDLRQLIELFPSNYSLLYAGEEDPVSEKETAQSKRHMRIIMQKPIAA